MEPARKAFAAAVKRGIDPEAMIEGARRYAIECNGKEARHIKNPDGWIADSRCQDEPSGAPVIDQDGNIVAYEEPQQQRQQDRVEELAQAYERKGGW